MGKIIMALAGVLLIVSGPSASADNMTLKLVERATTDAVTDLGAKDDSAGDLLTFANEIFDEGNANKLGDDNGWCIRTVPGKAWECFWTLSLASGQITVEGPFYDTGDSVLAITGGTGAFGNAQGDMLLSPIGTEGKAFRFTYRLQ